MDKKLQVKDLQISFRTQAGILKAVRNISFDLYKGETLAIVGESGSGKSVTSKAVMGILAGNSIVEGGEILYDGQDLLKISEEDFHKIRGDKIAMIFQDPMSSLNPLMRIGQQLTEAMILKAKTGRKNAKNAFNNLLKALGENINFADEQNGVDNKAEVAEKVQTFDQFCIKNTEIESVYNDANGNCVQLEVDAENLIVLIERNRKVNLIDELKNIQKLFVGSIHEYVICDSSEVQQYLLVLDNLIKQKKEAKVEDALPVVKKIGALAKEALNKIKPNFFTLAYYQMMNPTANLSEMSISEMNEMTREYLDMHFMNDFIKLAEKGVIYSHNASIVAKKNLLSELDEALAFFQKSEFEEKETNTLVKELNLKVTSAIDKLKVKKNSTEYVFASALTSQVKKYFDGVKRNPIEEKIYLKNKEKYNKLIEAGKNPDWILKPQIKVDLELQLGNI